MVSFYRRRIKGELIFVIITSGVCLDGILRVLDKSNDSDVGTSSKFIRPLSPLFFLVEKFFTILIIKVVSTSYDLVVCVFLVNVRYDHIPSLGKGMTTYLYIRSLRTPNVLIKK